jgi:GTP pyrophosphokinase
MNGEPYLTHPLEVANILAELRLDAVTVTAGLLHDVLEDTLVHPEELRKQFGEEVYQIVDGVTKISMQGQESFQITGKVRKEEAISREDIKMVAEQAEASEEEAREALSEAGAT